MISLRYNSLHFRVCFTLLITLTLVFLEFNLTFASAMTWLLFVVSISAFHLRMYSQMYQFPFYIFPYFWMLFSLTFISVFSSISIARYGIALPYMFERYTWQRNFPDAILLCALAFTCISFGTSLSNSCTNPQDRPTYKISWYRAFSLLIFAALLYAYWASTQGGLNRVLTTRTGLQLNGVQRNVGYLVDSPMIAVSIFVCFYIYSELNHLNLIIRLTILGCISALLTPYLLAGSRSIFIYVYLVCFIAKKIINSKEKVKISQVRLRNILILLFILPAIMVAPRIYRTDNSVNLESLKNAYTLKEISQTVIGGDALMIPTLSILIPEIGSKVESLHGASYLNLIAKPIPRALWSKKPIEFDMYLNNALFPETSRFYGVSFSAISEPLVNFGVFGVAVFFAFIGYLYDLLVIRKFELNLRSLIIASWLTGFCFILIRGNLTTDFHRVVFPLCIALFVIKREDAKYV